MKQIIMLLLLALITSTGAFAQKNKVDSVKIKYTCTMHPQVISDTPGKCPKCGMALVQKKIKVGMVKTYTCGMHPEVLSKTPGKCPKCGMALVEKKG